ncbi:MAG TPA: class I SAM-dependent methyltransferase [Solirubrobacteraceae bacterium]|nr:class I SAM-dependent methyltransferase [Solirubrobacteraceae bacterium]
MSAAADRCPVCGETGRAFVCRERVPVHQNQLFASADEARAAVVGELRICHCPTCDFVWNAAFDSGLLSYHHAYDNTQTCSPRFSDHLDALVTLLVVERGVRDARIVEVGCGNGEFLRRLVLGGPGNTGAGFDPSYRGPDEDLGGRVAFQRSFFGPGEATGEADVVVSRHVIEHVDEPIAILELMRSAIEAAPDPRLFLETPDVAWILEHRVVWDFFYEHCSYFTPRSLAYAAQLAGLEVVAVDLVFADQYQWVQARPAGPASSAAVPERQGLAAAAEEFERAERRLWQRLGEQVAELGACGPVAIWGAGAKGVTFANQIDPARESLACVIDLNPAKQGGYLPGTAHPIVSPQEAEERGVATAILLNPNYEPEIREMLAASGSRVTLVNADHVGVVNSSQEP